MIKKSAVRILVLDDEPFMLKLLGHVLAGLGYTRVSCYENGAAALASPALSGGMPDVILLGINMPEMDGLVDVKFSGFIVAEVQAFGVPPQFIILEVTETRLMQNLTIALDVLTRLRLKRFRLPNAC